LIRVQYASSDGAPFCREAVDRKKRHGSNCVWTAFLEKDGPQAGHHYTGLARLHAAPRSQEKLMSFLDRIQHWLHMDSNIDKNPELPMAPEGAVASVAAGLPAQSGSPAAAPQTLTPAAQGRVLLIHGYSANWREFLPWKAALSAAGIATETISVGNYVTLNNEVTIKDLRRSL
jgi:hypothetical protein